jgi:hypothetical protein
MSDNKFGIIIMFNPIDCTIFFCASDTYLLQVYELALFWWLNRLNAKLNPICHLLALLGAHHIFHVSGIRVNAIF